jgi:hypothetical protein
LKAVARAPVFLVKNPVVVHVVYTRTHDHSRMGVEAVGDPEIVSTKSDVPGNLELNRPQEETLCLKFNRHANT